ncbi:hypothetical protein EJB05_07663, partial [Eragrostis curvula]
MAYPPPGFAPRQRPFKILRRRAEQSKREARERAGKGGMGNCQAAEVATVVIQHPGGEGGGRTERAYWALSAGAVMAANPGHYVAAVITSPPDPNSSDGAAAVKHLKLLRPDDTLLLGRVYRLVSFEEVLREFTSKRHVKLSRVTVKVKDEDGGGEEKAKAKPPANPRRRRSATSTTTGGGGEIRKESERSLAKVMRQMDEPEHEPAHSSGPNATTADAPSDLDRDLEALLPPHGVVIGRRFARQWRPALQSIAEG